MYLYNYAKIITEIESTISFLHTNSVFAYETCLQNEKNTKAFVNLLNFGMGRCRTRSWRFQRRFKEVSKYEFAILLAARKQTS